MKTQDYNVFWQRIHKDAKSKGFPLRVMFELTYRCNFYCRHCYIPPNYRNHKELKTKEVFSILDQLADAGCFYLGFTGGEPFVRKDIMEILWYAKQKGFEIIIYTNGSLIDKKIANEIADLRPNKVDITIQAVTKTAFDRISGVPGSRDKVFRAIDFLYKSGVNLGFKSCVLKENESEIEKMQDFAASLNVLYRLDNVLSPRLDGSKEPYLYRGSLKSASNKLEIASVEKFEDCNLDLELSADNYLGKSKTKDRQLNIADLFKCGAGRSQVAITPLGELKICLLINSPKYRMLDNNNRTLKGNAQTQKANLEKAWGMLKKFTASIKPGKDYKCDRCELRAHCRTCPARGWLYNQSLTSCDPENYRTAKIRRQLNQVIEWV